MTYEHLGLRLPEIGRVKLGQKGAEKISKNGNKFQQPEKLDHFKIVKLGRGSDNNFEIDTRAHEIYGEKPKCLTVRPISERLEENIQAGFNLYSTAGVRLCFGDGQTGNQIDAQTGEVKTRQCPCAEYEENRCKKYAKTSFFLDKVGGLGGVHTMTIRGRITVPALVGSLKYLTAACEDVGKSIAGVPLELRLNEVMTKHGKVYSPYFLFPGTREELFDLAVSANSSKFRVLADEDEEADDTEEGQTDGAAYPEGEETVNNNPKDDAPADYVAPAPEKTEKPEKPAKADKKKAEPKTEAPKVETPKADAPKTETTKTEEKPPLKAYWCDSCHKIANDYKKPSQCGCGEMKIHEAENMQAAQAAIVKKVNAKQAAAYNPPPAAGCLTFWCDACKGIITSSSKPITCPCGASHWHGAGSIEGAKRAIDALAAAAEADKKETEKTENSGALLKTKEQRDKQIGAIGAGIKKTFGFDTQESILKQISFLLDRNVDGSQHLSDDEIDQLTELLYAVKDFPAAELDSFIGAWRQGRKERGE